MASEKTDLFALNKKEYAATRAPRFVDVDTAWFLCLDGNGHPGGEQFQIGVQALYSVAYALKMRSKKAGRDYAVSKLEGLWSLEPGYDDFASAPHDAWQWTIMIRTPDFIGEQELERARAEILAKGKPSMIKHVALQGFEEGRCVQMLHVGPYSGEVLTLKVMREFIDQHGLSVVGRHHEIYLSAPSRTAPEKLRTIIRLPVM